MDKDPIEKGLLIASAFDWITPLWQWLAGYNHCHLATDDYFTAALARDALKARGIDAKLFIGISSYMVVTKAPVETMETSRPARAINNIVDFPDLAITKTEPGFVRLIRWLASKI